MFSRSYVCSNHILTDTFIDNDKGLEHESDSHAYVSLRNYEDNTHNIDNIVQGIHDLLHTLMVMTNTCWTEYWLPKTFRFGGLLVG